MTDNYTKQRNDLAARFTRLPNGQLDYARADAVLAYNAAHGLNRRPHRAERILEPEYATEQELTWAIIKELRARGCICFHSDAGHTTNATSSKRGRPPKGFPDIPVYAPNGVHVLLEVKQPTGNLSQDQSDFIKSIRKLGQYVAIVRSVQDAVIAVFGDALEMRKETK